MSRARTTLNALVAKQANSRYHSGRHEQQESWLHTDDRRHEFFDVSTTRRKRDPALRVP